MRENIEKRACELGNYIIENKSTVRATAKKFGISKSTVHKVVTKQRGFPTRNYYIYSTIQIQNRRLKNF